MSIQFTDPVLYQINAGVNTTLQSIVTQLEAGVAPVNLIPYLDGAINTINDSLAMAYMRRLAIDMRTENQLLGSIPVFSLLSGNQALLVTNRMNAYKYLVNIITSTVPVHPTYTLSNLAGGASALDFIDLLSLWSTQVPELVPSQYVTGSDVSIYSSDMVAALGQLITNMGIYTTVPYTKNAQDAVNRLYAMAVRVDNSLPTPINLLDGGIHYTINQIVALPTLLWAANAALRNISTQDGQTWLAWAYRTRIMLANLQSMSSSLRMHLPRDVSLSKVQYGDTIQSFAARATGDIENWPRIVAANKLIPPYINGNPTFSNSGGEAVALQIPGVATPGDMLFLPKGNATVPGGTQPNYKYNVLGVDWSFGRPSVPMVPWNGDIPIIYGYHNLEAALARRLITPIGALAVHPTYGSYLPSEVGALATASISSYITAYTKAAILSDPRVDTVDTVTASPGDYTIVVDATVKPVGLENTLHLSDEVIQPLP